MVDRSKFNDTKEDAMTRAVIFSIAVVVSTLAGVQSGNTYYEGPWCMKAPVGRAIVDLCHFRTFEQCLQERMLWGGSAFCGQNPHYLPYWRARNAPAARNNVR